MPLSRSVTGRQCSKGGRDVRGERAPVMRIVRFLFDRFVAGLVVLVGVSVLIFVLARVIPGDPARLALGPTAPPEQVEVLRARLGLDAPLLVQYGRFVTNALRYDFGISLYTNRPVAQDIAESFPATFELVLLSTFFVVVFGVGLGVLGARYRDTWLDSVLRLFSVIGVVSPTFVWAIFFMLVFSFWFELFPVGGRLSEGMLVPPDVTGLYVIDTLLAGHWYGFFDAVHHLILPAIALALPALGQTARLTRTNLAEVDRAPYIETARAYAFREDEIVLKFALRPAAIPTLTIIGLEFVALFGNAFLVETVFVWPGMARYGVQTILHKDLNGIVATVLVMALLFVFVNALVDLIVTFVNPRIRLAWRS